MSEILIATTDAVVNLDGDLVTIRKDVTRVESTHPLAKKNPSFFKPVSDDLHFATRTTRKEPQVKRRAKKTAVKKAAAAPEVKAEPKADEPKATVTVEADEPKA